MTVLNWKPAARAALHGMGGLAALRLLQRGKFRVLMFHEFPVSCRANLDRICEHIARSFEPLPLSTIAAAIARQAQLPPNAVTVTVDDGYRNFLHFGYPSFAHWKIPTTIYVVSGFSDRRLWLWTDQIRFALEQTNKTWIAVPLGEQGGLDLDLSSASARAQAAHELSEALKTVPNERRLQCLADLPSLCRLEIPPAPPADRTALNWEELRALAADGVEIGCHTDSHPILSRISDSSQLEREIRGARQLMEERLNRSVSHFCYPNGRTIDIGDLAVECVRRAGFASSVTCTYGLNTLAADPLRIMRLPCDSEMNPEYAAELLAGLHLTSAPQSTS